MGDIEIAPSDIRWEFCRGRGKGGQNRNKRDTAVRLIHIPTDIQIWCEEERSQHENKRKAMERLKSRLLMEAISKHNKTTNANRKSQVGCGMRGDKIRTLRVRDNQVTNHVNGKKMPFVRYAKGELEPILS